MSTRSTEYRTTVQALFRNATSEHFAHPDGIYHAPTAPLTPPAEPGCWMLHSVQQLLLGIGEPKLLVTWVRYDSEYEPGGDHIMLTEAT